MNYLIEQDKVFEFKNCIYSYTKENDLIVKTNKSLYELMANAEYTL